MSGDWTARFEFVTGPHDGLTFAITGAGVEMGPEAQGATPALVADLVNAVPEVAGGGVRLRRAAAFTLNGKPAGSDRPIADGDVVRIGRLEALLLEHRGPQAPDDRGDEHFPGVPAPLGRTCLRPGCGAVNPPDAKWCLTCGWDLGEIQ